MTPPKNTPTDVSYNSKDDTFTGTMALTVKLAMKAIQELGWKITQANESLGLVTFETGVSWGSWSGVSWPLNIEEVSEFTYRVIGTGKQNIRGGQLLAFDFGEAKARARKAIERMKHLGRNLSD